MLPSRLSFSRRSAAEIRYRDLRQLAFQDAMTALAGAGVDADLRLIDAAALAAAMQWASRRVAWPWHDMAADWRRSHPERFEVAVWRGDILCALALGRPAPSAPHLSLYYVERNPDPANPLRGKVTGAVIEALVAYAFVLDKTELRLVNPLPEVVSRYCSPEFGFHLVTPVREDPYCVRSI